MNLSELNSMECLSRRQFLQITLQLLAWASLPGCTQRLPELGRSSFAAPFIVEDHSELLLHWAQQGIRDAVLVNLDTHDDFHIIPDEKITALDDIYRRKNWQQFAGSDSRTAPNRGLYNIGNWIFAGARLGVFKEIYWIIPFSYFKRDDAALLLPMFLEFGRFTAEDIRTFVLKDNQFKGTIRGIPVTICGLESLPTIKKPILLSVDTDFFPTYIDDYKVTYLTALHTTFTALYAKKYQILDAAVCYSINGGYLLPHHRWVGDTVAQILKKPDLVNEAPTEQLNLLQQLDNAYRTADAAEIHALSGAALQQRPGADLLLYKAYAYMLEGNAEQAYLSAMSSCQLNRLYCSALSYMGTLYYGKGMYQVAERFYRGGFSVNPDMRNGLFHFGNCLLKRGKYSEALQIYEKDVALNGSFPTHFMMVETLLKLGDRQAAARTLDVAIKNLQMYLSVKVESQTAANAIYAALEFCDQSGFNEMGGSLRGEPAIKQMFQDFPRQRLH